MSDLLSTLLSMWSGWGALYMVGGVFLGMLFGILPGLGGPQVLALMLPLTYSMDAQDAIIMMIGAMAAVPTGGSITAVLLNTPGTAQNLMTTLDGFALTRKGRATEALGAAISASVIGGVLGAVILAIAIPQIRPIVLAFSYPEFFMMAMLGLAAVAAVSQGSLLRGLAAAVFGLLLSTVGLDIISGEPRFTFGWNYLYDGIRLIPAVIGLFAISEALELMSRGQPVVLQVAEGSSARSGLWKGVKAPIRHWWLTLKSAAIGILIGVIPGVGGTVANFLAYSQAAKTEKNNHFGQGDIRGVIAPEAANNAKDGGALVPAFAFGIPGSLEVAIFMGALVLHGLTPGPRMLVERPDLISAAIITLAAGEILAGIIGLAAARQLLRITFMPTAVVAPIVFSLSLVGAYANHGYFADVAMALAFGVLGYYMKRHGFPRVAVVLGLILGPLAQSSYHQTLLALGAGAFFTRPISAALALTIVVMLIAPYVGKRERRRAA